MIKHLKLLIVSGLIFSFIYPHTIHFTEEVNGEIVDRVVKDVLYLGINNSRVYYKIKIINQYSKNISYSTVNINCKDVYMIVDNNDEAMKFSCSDSTYIPNDGLSYSEIIKKNNQRNFQTIIEQLDEELHKNIRSVFNFLGIE
tara:strand:- start:122 stop:550 length:429 start_codon:yes stop_codon:yes gene_type:complete